MEEYANEDVEIVSLPILLMVCCILTGSVQALCLKILKDKSGIQEIWTIALRIC